MHKESQCTMCIVHARIKQFSKEGMLGVPMEDVPMTSDRHPDEIVCKPILWLMIFWLGKWWRVVMIFTSSFGWLQSSYLSSPHLGGWLHSSCFSGWAASILMLLLTSSGWVVAIFAPLLSISSHPARESKNNVERFCLDDVRTLFGWRIKNSRYSEVLPASSSAILFSPVCVVHIVKHCESKLANHCR